MIILKNDNFTPEKFFIRGYDPKRKSYLVKDLDTGELKWVKEIYIENQNKKEK